MCLVGINLLREGLDLPEVSLVAILDADKEGFLRAERRLSRRSAVRRATRTVASSCMRIRSRNRWTKRSARRSGVARFRLAHNEKHGITPQTIRKKVQDVIEATKVAEEKADYLADVKSAKMSKKDRQRVIERLEEEMKEAAKNLQFERAAELRDALLELKAQD